MQKQQITKEGYTKLQKEHEDLLVTRKEAIADLQKAREMGDLSENGYYKAAKMKLGDVYRRLRELTGLLKSTTAVSVEQTDRVSMDCFVTIDDGAKQQTYHIVSEWEADPREHKLSDKSPLGQVLFGKKSGDEVVMKSPSGEKKYKIVKITT